MSSMSEKDLKNLAIIALFCLFFLALRLIQPHNFSHDEAEQYLNASEFFLGFHKQPPLYSWLLWGFSKLFGLNLITLTCFKYLVYFAFLGVYYALARIFFDENKSFISLSSLLLFVTYIFDFNRDLTHTILLSFFAVLSFYLYILILKKPSSLNYFIFGLTLGLGFLSKYNFAFVASAIALACLSSSTGRKALFNSKSFLSLASFITVLSPHLLWLYQQGFVGFTYAIQRGEQSTSFDFSALIKSLFFGYYELLLVFIVLFFLWFSFYKKSSHQLRRTVNLAAIFAVLIPALVTIFFGFSSFYAKWLASIYFLPILSFFLNLEFTKQARQKIQYSLILVLILAVSVYQAAGSYYPDLVGKPKNILYPYHEIFQDLKNKLGEYEDKDIVFISSQRELLRANITQQQKKYMPDAKVIKKSQFKNHKNKKIFVLFWKDSKEEPQLPKPFAKSFANAKIQESIKAKLINSDQHYYQLAWAIAPALK